MGGTEKSSGPVDGLPLSYIDEREYNFEVDPNALPNANIGSPTSKNALSIKFNR